MYRNDMPRPTRGLSTLEVMISIGVAIIGLLGALALLPVAGSLTSRGLNADRAARVGMNAVEEFDVRGFRSPEFWVRRGPDGLYPVNPLTDATLAGTAFCIDPRFYAINTRNLDTGLGGAYPPFNVLTAPGANFSPPLAPQVDAGYFPYYQPAVGFPRMIRISLLSHSNVPLPLSWAAGSPAMYPTNSVVPAQMSLLQASDIFSGRDDLAFRRPDDNTLPPQQVFSPVANPLFGTNSMARREYDAQLSWLATVAPKSTASNTDLYTLSIVIFHQRNAGFPLPRTIDYAGTRPQVQTERLLNATFLRGDFSAKELVLTTRPFLNGNPDAAKAELSVQEGDWLMLSASTPSGQGLFRWCRIIDTDSEAMPLYNQNNGAPDPSREWKRGVVIDGPDWLSESYRNTSTGLPLFPTQATLVTDVIAVFEKTIRLESSSLWR